MARFVTLLDMVTAIQRRGGYENSTDITKAMLVEFINEAVSELWDVLKSKRDDRLVVAVTATTTPGVDNIDLSALSIQDLNGHSQSFYELRKLEIADPSRRSGWRRLFKIDLDVSHQFGTLVGKEYRYRMQGSSGTAGSAESLVLHPTPQAVETLRLYVVPSAPVLVNDGDNLNSISGFEELVYQLAWRRCRDRQEQDLTSVDREIARLMASISTRASSRDREPRYLNPYGARGASSWWGDDEP